MFIKVVAFGISSITSKSGKVKIKKRDPIKIYKKGFWNLLVILVIHFAESRMNTLKRRITRCITTV